MDDKIIYKDNLIEITSNAILFKHYYIPGISKRVPFEKINSVIIEQPSLSTGKWRIWGTRNFSTWYPLDIFRPKRDRIFIMSLVGKRVRIGFTAENSEAVRLILEEKKIINGATA
jgi:hypothetical protein